MTRPRLDHWSDVPEFDAPHEAVQTFKEQFDREGCQAFLAAHPEFPQTEANAFVLLKWCGDLHVPASRHNLEIALRELKGASKLEDAAPTQDSIGRLVTKEIEIRPVEAAQVAEPTPQERKTLEAVKDDPSLSDHARKQRDEKLKRAATQSRITHRRHDPDAANRRILIS
jgi:hypothetical protein